MWRRCCSSDTSLSPSQIASYLSIDHAQISFNYFQKKGVLKVWALGLMTICAGTHSYQIHGGVDMTKTRDDKFSFHSILSWTNWKNIYNKTFLENFQGVCRPTGSGKVLSILINIAQTSAIKYVESLHPKTFKHQICVECKHTTAIKRLKPS